MISSILTTMAFLGQIENSVNALKEKAIKEYQEARNLPRKKKKKARTSALLLYNIACWGEDIIKI